MSLADQEWRGRVVTDSQVRYVEQTLSHVKDYEKKLGLKGIMKRVDKGQKR